MKDQLQKILDRCEKAIADTNDALERRDPDDAMEAQHDLGRLAWEELPRITAALIAVYELTDPLGMESHRYSPEMVEFATKIEDAIEEEIDG